MYPLGERRNEMITATEARALGATANQVAERQMQYIENRIKKAIDRNESSITIGVYDRKDIVKCIACSLMALGYRVYDEYSFEHHGWYIHISW